MASESDTDSSSEDESQRQRLLDAAVDVTSFVKSSTSNRKSAGTEIQNQLKTRKFDSGHSAPSKRPSNVDQQELENELNTTPEFRSFVSKKLSQMLDKQIEEDQSDSLTCTQYEDTGIRLFRGSTQALTSDCNTGSPPSSSRKRVHKKRTRKSSSSDSSEEDQRLAEAAVSHDFIIKQSKVIIGSQNGQSDVIKAFESVDNTMDELSVPKEDKSMTDNKFAIESKYKDKITKKKKKKHKKEIKDT